MSVVSCELSVVSKGARSEERETESETKSAFRLPPSAFRLGLSLTEVLIAMGILTVGLLSVASIFPVGSFYMQKAEISDRGSAIAQSVMNDVMTRGMLNPRSWYVISPSPGITTIGSWNTNFTPDGKYSWWQGKKDGTFTRPFALSLSEALNQPTAATDRTLIAKQFGTAYVIDPLYVSLMSFPPNNDQPPNVWANAPGTLFPAIAYYDFGWYASAPAWVPWTGGASSYNGYEWPIRRVTFRQSSSGLRMDATTAGHYFRGNDDLATDLPARDDRPGIQLWETANGTPLARQWNGDYSWIVSVAPTTNAARDGMASNPESYNYDVSVVVFYKRVLPDSADITYKAANNAPKLKEAYHSAMGASERVVKANVVSTGLNGGELLLTDWGDFYDMSGVKKSNAFDRLKTGQWVMLCGPHPNSSASEPRFALNWYQVVSVEAAQSGMYGYDQNYTQRLVTLRGSQWPWQPIDPTNAVGAASPSNALCVGICPGAVAVHTKTMRLEGRSAFSVSGGGSGGSGGDFGAAGNPSMSPSPYTFQ
jgi:Tfp pilus assembly protein PilV